MSRQLVFFLTFLAFGQISAQNLQLAPPQTPSTRIFASNGQTLSFDFRLEGAEIRYTTDGSEPTTASPVYHKQLTIKGLKTIKAKSFKSGFLPSEAITVQLVNPGSIAIDSISISPSPKKYLAEGWKTLCDGKLGDENFQQHWLGFDEKTVEAYLFFEKKQRVSQISIGFLRQQGAWIFGPSQILVYDEKDRILASHQIMDAATEQPATQTFISILLPKRKCNMLKIKVLALPTLPDWHPGKGSTGWLFLDEIMVQ